MQVSNSTNNITQTNLTISGEKASEESFNNYLKESVETMEDIRIKHNVEQNIIDEFLNKNSVGYELFDKPKNIEKLFNPLNTKTKSETSISFMDEFSNQEVTIELNESNLEKLKDKFGSLENAKEFVKKWYNDAAYGVGYLQQDVNSDGIISQDEALKLNSLVDLASNDGYMSIEEAISSKEQQLAFLNQFGYINNINDFINNSIAQDENFDGLLSNSELLGEKELEVVDAMLSKKEMDIFAFNELLSDKLKDVSALNYSRIAQHQEDELLSAILQEV